MPFSSRMNNWLPQTARCPHVSSSLIFLESRRSNFSGVALNQQQFPLLIQRQDMALLGHQTPVLAVPFLSFPTAAFRWPGPRR